MAQHDSPLLLTLGLLSLALACRVESSVDLGDGETQGDASDEASTTGSDSSDTDSSDTDSSDTSSSGTDSSDTETDADTSDTDSGETSENDDALCEAANCIHVAKTGSDEGSGTAEDPYLTLAKAADLAAPGDVVLIHEGTYEETLRPMNSGTSDAPIVFKGAAGEKAIITAMQSLSGWSLSEGMIYETTVDWSLGQENFVIHDETALDLARWPNNVDGDPVTQDTLRNTGGSGPNVEFDAWLDYANGIPEIDWSDGGSVHFYGDSPGSGWTTWRAFIKTHSATQVTFDLNKNPTWIRTFHAPGDLGDFFLQGARGALDFENEWYLDEDTGTLYVQLPGGLAPADGAVKMRRRAQTVDLTGRDYITLWNLAVFGGSVDIDGTGNHLLEVSSFYGNHTLGVVTGFSSNAQSVWIKGSENVIEKCEIAYGAGTGIYDAGVLTRVENSHVHHFNSLGNYDAVLNARGGAQATYVGNTLSHSGRDIVQAFNDESEYAYNDISYSNLIVDDCALIYTVGGPSNSVIHHNWLHDAYSSGDKHKAAGIYLDNDSENWVVHHNVVWNTEWSNVQINWDGTNLDIFNNTLVKGSATMGAWHKEGTAFSNVRVWNNLTELPTEWEEQADKQNNLVSPESFVDLAGNDYRLVDGAPAVDAGMQIPGITDDAEDGAPDIGAYELGDDWVPGIDWDPLEGPSGSGCYHLPGELCSE